jgi:hypothetical protein
MGAVKKMKVGMSAGVLGVVMLLAANADAARVDLFVFQNSSGVDTTGLDLWVDVLDVGGTQVDFVFHNDSTIPSIISQIYFESTLGSLISGGAIHAQTAGVSFQVGATPSSPPGGTNIGWAGEIIDFGNTDAIGGVNNGINAGVGENLTIRFSYVGATAVNDVLDALQDDGRIAAHVRSVGDEGESIAVVTGVIVPLPAAAWMGLATLGGIGLAGIRRWRRGD